MNPWFGAKMSLLQTDQSLYSSSCSLFRQKWRAVSHWGTHVDVEKVCPQDSYSGGISSKYLVDHMDWGSLKRLQYFYCFRNFISVFLRRHQRECFLICPWNPVVKLDVQAQYYLKGTSQLTIGWCKNSPHQMAFTEHGFLWSLAASFKFFEKQPW